MDTNPYAPPQATITDAVDPAARPANAPALWNPKAAVFWSLALTPAFGAFLHMKNWKALGEPEKAYASRQWLIGIIVATFVLAAAGFFLPESKAFDLALRGAGIGQLVAWYALSARPQIAVVLGRYGKTYPRRGWLMPVLLGLGALAGLLVLTAALTLGLAVSLGMA